MSNFLQETIEIHNTLNPLLWTEDDDELKPEVAEKIQQIVDEFLLSLEENDIKIVVKDIKIVGSNCSYNYSKDSDLDVHIEADTETLDCPENLYPKLYSAYRSIFNNKFDISFYGIPVELYVETEETPMVSNGIYSVMQGRWIKEPVAEDIPEIDQDEFIQEFQEWEDRYNAIMDEADARGINVFSELTEDYEEQKSIIADQIRGEWDAIKDYKKAVVDLENCGGDFGEVIDILNSIADEEMTHTGELTKALSYFDPEINNKIEDGIEEAEEDED